jgi:hypothetical protein
VRGGRATATALRSGFSLDPNTTNKGFSCFRPGAYFKTISHPLVLAKPNRGRITRLRIHRCTRLFVHRRVCQKTTHSRPNTRGRLLGLMSARPQVRPTGISSASGIPSDLAGRRWLSSPLSELARNKSTRLFIVSSTARVYRSPCTDKRFQPALCSPAFGAANRGGYKSSGPRAVPGSQRPQQDWTNQILHDPPFHASAPFSDREPSPASNASERRGSVDYICAPPLRSQPLRARDGSRSGGTHKIALECCQKNKILDIASCGMLQISSIRSPYACGTARH